MLTFRYSTPWEAHWTAQDRQAEAWLKKLFTFVDYADTYSKKRFGYFPQICYLDTTHHRMTHGQVLQVLEAAKKAEIPCQIENEYPRYSWDPGEIPEDWLPGIKLYDYQRLAIQIACQKGHGICQAGTGAGKTVIMGGIAKLITELTQCSGLLIMINSKDLLNQTARRFESYGIPASDIGIIHSGKTAKQQAEAAECRVVLSTHLSISKFHGVLQRVQYVFCDEAHEVIGPLWTAIFNRLPNLLNVLGFSATPWDSEDERFKMCSIFGRILFDIPIPFLIRRKLLMNPEIYFIELEYKDRDREACTQMSWQDAKQRFCLEDRNRNLLPIVVLKRLGGRMLVIYDEVKHGKLLLSLYEEQGIPARLADGKTSTRQRDACLDWFAEPIQEGGKVLLASKIFNQGIDMENGCDILFIAGPKAKKRIAKQRLGRSLRLNTWARQHGDFKRLKVFDVWDKNHPKLAKWSGARKGVFAELGLGERIHMIKPEDISNLSWS